MVHLKRRQMSVMGYQHLPVLDYFNPRKNHSVKPCARCHVICNIDVCSIIDLVFQFPPHKSGGWRWTHEREVCVCVCYTYSLPAIGGCRALRRQIKNDPLLHVFLWAHSLHEHKSPSEVNARFTNELCNVVLVYLHFEWCSHTYQFQRTWFLTSRWANVKKICSLLGRKMWISWLKFEVNHSWSTQRPPDVGYLLG